MENLNPKLEQKREREMYKGKWVVGPFDLRSGRDLVERQNLNNLV